MGGGSFLCLVGLMTRGGLASRHDGGVSRLNLGNLN